MKKSIKKYQPGGPTGKKLKSNTANLAANKAKVEANKKKVADNAAKVRANAVSAVVEKGKPNSSNKGVYKGKEFDSKGNLIDKYDVSSKSGPRSIYTTASGEVSRYTYDPKTGKRTNVSIDTTGYSSGKKEFTEFKREYPINNSKSGKITTSKVPSKDIPNKLKEMQKMKKGGVVKKASAKKTITKSKRR